MRTVLHLLVKLWFRFRAYNVEVLTTPGPVLLVPNHVSWIDWLFLGAVLDGDWKFVTSSTSAELSWLHRKIMTGRRTFPVDTTSPYAVRAMADHLAGGGKLVLFAEGRISITGALMKVYDGTGFLIHKTDAKVITCYLRGASRVRWVRQPGWKKWFPRVSAHFSEVLTAPSMEGASYSHARQKLAAWLRDRMVQQQFEVEMEQGPRNVLAAIAETAGHIPRRPALEDISFKPLSYRRLMVGTDVLAAEWRRRLGPRAGERIGVMLPNVNGLPVTLLSL
jgi:acyl-[acyl-carrier-protein]-phospholipid O-acyltransferase / long-chain-fatty-acid--[acyl-carrier-protein] ligase